MEYVGKSVIEAKDFAIRHSIQTRPEMGLETGLFRGIITIHPLYGCFMHKWLWPDVDFPATKPFSGGLLGGGLEHSGLLSGLPWGVRDSVSLGV